jgi:hypothetical protein
MLAKRKAELRKNGRAETIRATGAVLIDSVLLYFCPNTRTTAKNQTTHSTIYIHSARPGRRAKQKKEGRDV